MMAFSGVFFSLEGTQLLLRKLSRIFPLTHYIEAARAIMLDGAGLADILPNIIVLIGMTALYCSNGNNKDCSILRRFM